MRENITFTPNWQRLGLASKEEGMKRAINALFTHKKSILKHGLFNREDGTVETTLTWQGRTLILKGKVKKK